MTLQGLLLIIVVAYIGPLVIGYAARRIFYLDSAVAQRFSPYLADPLTVMFKKGLHTHFNQLVREKRSALVFLIIFTNNLFLGAFVTHTLYGLLFFIPLLLTVWSGFWRGVIYGKIGALHILNPVGLFEFTGYLLASACGVSLGLNLLEIFIPSAGTLIESSFLDSLISLYPYTALLLALGALVETLFLVRVGGEGEKYG